MQQPAYLLERRYLIERLIKRGGMGAVYLARDQRLDTEVALKETSFSDEQMLAAFEREARLLARLRHPALPKVIDRFTEGDRRFLVMEYIPGDDLEAQIVRQGKAFHPNLVIHWADQLLSALEYLHKQNPPVIHRDIKPQNLKLSEEGHLILLDFGIAKGATMVSVYAGTPAYSPLEQLMCKGTDCRSDLYSAAVTIYHLLTGAVPPSPTDRVEATLSGLPDPVPLASQLNPEVPDAVAVILRDAMGLYRHQRFESATAMRQALRSVISSSFNSGEIPTILTPPHTRPNVSPAVTVRPEGQPMIATPLPGQPGMMGPVAVQPRAPEAIAAVAKKPLMKRLFSSFNLWAGVWIGIVVSVLVFAGVKLISLSQTSKTPPAPYVRTFSNTETITIPASGSVGPAAPYPSDIIISGITDHIDKVKVDLLSLSHTHLDDLHILLVGPDGTGVVLLADVGGSTHLSSTNLTFDDEAALAVTNGIRAGTPGQNSNSGNSNSSGTPPTLASGTYHPTNGASSLKLPSVSPQRLSLGLTSYKDISPNGTWHLYVFDDANGDVGTMSGGWKLTIVLVQPSAASSR